MDLAAKSHEVSMAQSNLSIVSFPPVANDCMLRYDIAIGAHVPTLSDGDSGQREFAGFLGFLAPE